MLDRMALSGKLKAPMVTVPFWAVLPELDVDLLSLPQAAARKARPTMAVAAILEERLVVVGPLHISATSLCSHLAGGEALERDILVGFQLPQPLGHDQVLQPGQCELGEDRQTGHQDGSGEDLDEVPLGDPVHDEAAQPAPRHQ